ncbi:hypothetical protein GC169_12530 [bacterium]|nr:hypothetical protein [bacterium]
MRSLLDLRDRASGTRAARLIAPGASVAVNALLFLAVSMSVAGHATRFPDLEDLSTVNVVFERAPAPDLTRIESATYVPPRAAARPENEPRERVPAAPPAPALPRIDETGRGEERSEPGGDPAAVNIGPSRQPGATSPTGIDDERLRRMLGQAACEDIQLRRRADCPPIGAYLRYNPDQWIGAEDVDASEFATSAPFHMGGGPDAPPGGTLPSSGGVRRGRSMQSGVQGLGGVNDLVGRLPPIHPDPGFKD